MIYGYARVSTDGQSVGAQVGALTAAGAAKVFRETVSGAKTDRAQLRKALTALEAGDVLIVTRLDRLARSTRDLLNTLATITGRKAGFRSLGDTWADTTTAHGRLMLTVLGGLAEFERELIRARTGEGRERAKARGVKMGAQAEAYASPEEGGSSPPRKRRGCARDCPQLQCPQQHDFEIGTMNHVHKPPQHVTRFYGNVDYALDVIANRQITFTHVSTLNDPFDPYFFFETDFGQSRERLLKHVKHSHPGDFVWFKKKVTAQSWDKAMKHVEAKIASWRDNTFVFSTSGMRWCSA